MNNIDFGDLIEKSCLTGCLILSCLYHRLKAYGYENQSFQDKLQKRLEKSDFHNRKVIDLREKSVNKETA